MKLYVGTLSYSVNDSALRALFEPFGNIEAARVISDRDTGSSKGFGFVEMSDADGQKAMGALNGKDNDGRALKVNEAKPQENRGGGGGYGGGGAGERVAVEYCADRTCRGVALGARGRVGRAATRGPRQCRRPLALQRV